MSNLSSALHKVNCIIVSNPNKRHDLDLSIIDIKCYLGTLSALLALV
jgi:hypothetical protein